MHDLPGMSAASPIGFLAALGMLRVLARDCQLDVRLAWRDGHAVVDGIDPDTAISEITHNMAGRSQSPEFTWTDSLRGVPPESYRNACAEMREDQRALGFMAGWATDAIVRQGSVVVTRLDMTSGQQKLLRDLRGLAERVTPDHFHCALLGGAYENQTSFGLDPIAVRSHAHEPKAPTKTAPPGKPGLIWLAFEAIPLHPVVPVAANIAKTTGWRRHPEAAYVWPIWEAFLSLQEVILLRALPVDRLPYRPGMTEVWSSRYGSSGKYGMLLPPLRER
ncbi:MAG: hypothetical protein K9N21_20030 [Deltaproteobacteria bacterium]|nr:hypothetical protein [Deltaproteobacteria bacterium]